MEQLVAIAKRLRTVRSAYRKFLALWALEQDRNHANIARSNEEKQLAHPMNHDWSLLYLDGVLND